MRVLTIADGAVNEVAFAPDGGTLAAAVSFAGLFLCLLDGSAAPMRLSFPRTNRQPIGADSLVFHPSGGLSWVSFAVRYERDPGGGLVELPGPTEPETVGRQVGCRGGRLVALTHEVLATSSGRRPAHRIRSWLPIPAGGWAEGWTVGPTDHYLGTLTFGPTDHYFGTLVAAGDRYFTSEKRPQSSGQELVCRSAGTGEVVGRVPDHDPQFVLNAGSPDGSQAVAAGYTRVRVWKVGEAPRLVQVGTRKHFTGAAFHPSGAYLAASNTDGTVRLFDTTTWQVVRQYDWGLGRLECVAFSPDGTLGAAGTADGRVVLWDADD